MELLQLRYFCVVAKHQNVTQAAAELMISQPSLSKTLKALESEVGCALFERTGKYIRLNRAGEIFYQNIARSLNLLDDTLQELSDFSQSPSGEVHLSILAASAYLPELYAGFSRRYPHIKLMISNYIQSERFAPKDWDIRFFASETYKPSPHGNSIPLLTERMALGVPQGHPLAGRSSVDLAEAANERFIASNLTADLERFCQMVGFIPNIVVQCDNGTTYTSLLKNRVGITVLPETTLGSLLSPEIVCIPLSRPKLRRTIVLSWNAQRYMSTASRLFYQFCVDYFKKIRQRQGPLPCEDDPDALTSLEKAEVPAPEYPTEW